MKIAVTFALFVSIAAGQQAPDRAAQHTREFLGLGPAPDAAAAGRGSKLYAGNCIFCHGAKATGGDTGPDLIRSTVVLHDQKGETVGPVIHSGRPARGMPAFPAFSDAQLYDIAEFLHMRVELTANRGTYQVLSINGDAAAGKAYFNGPGECAHCHSPSGDLAHIGTKYTPVDLQQLFLYPERRGEGKAAPNVEVTLASGEMVKGTLKYLDDFLAVVQQTDGTVRTINRDNGVVVHVEDSLQTHRELLDRYTDQNIHNITTYLATLK